MMTPIIRNEARARELDRLRARVDELEACLDSARRERHAQFVATVDWKRLAENYLEERDALEAHLEACRHALQLADQTPLDRWYDAGVNVSIARALAETPATSLARRDARMKAEGVAELIDRIPGGCDFGRQDDARQLRDEYLDQAEGGEW